MENKQEYILENMHTKEEKKKTQSITHEFQSHMQTLPRIEFLTSFFLSKWLLWLKSTSFNI